MALIAMLRAGLLLMLLLHLLNRGRARGRIEMIGSNLLLGISLSQTESNHENRQLQEFHNNLRRCIEQLPFQTARQAKKACKALQKRQIRD